MTNSLYSRMTDFIPKSLFPSLVTFALILGIFLYCTTIKNYFVGSPKTSYQRTFKDHLSDHIKGTDFYYVHRTANRFARKSRVYPPYCFPPQSFALFLPFYLMPYPLSYYVLISLSFISLFVFFWLSSRKLCPGQLPLLLLFFPSAVFMSHAGVYLYERGNLDALGAIFIFSAFYSILIKRWKVSAVLLALASCLKVIYLPFFLLLFFFPQWKKQVLAYLITHLVLAVAVVIYYGSFDIFWQFFAFIPKLTQTVSLGFGATNISLPSLLSLILRKIGLGEWAFYVMTAFTSFVILGLFFIIALWVFGRGLKKSDEDRVVLLFGLLTYITVLWQFWSITYGVLILLLLVPICDQIYERIPKGALKALLWLHALLLGLVFAPNELRLPLLGSFKGLYVIVGFIVFVGIAWQTIRYNKTAQ